MAYTLYRSANRHFTSHVSEGIAAALSRIEDEPFRERFIRELAKEFPQAIFEITPSGAVRIDDAA